MKIARFWMLWAGLLCLALTPCVLANDVVTLNSGEVITGTITSQNATQLVIEVSNASRTIFHSRSVPKSEIKANQSETAAEKQERLAYESVQKYQLNPDQEFTVAQYDAGLTACQKYLESYSASDYAALVRQRAGQLQQEKEQVGIGLVKLAGHWMSPAQKVVEQDLIISYRKLQQAQRVVDSLKEQEAEFLRRRRELEDRQTDLGTLESRRGYDSTTKFLREQLLKDGTDLRRKQEDFYKASAWNEAPPYLRLAKKEYATAKAKRDSLMASSPPPQKPAPATQAATTTPPVPPERTKEETPTTPTAPAVASEPAIPPSVRSFSLTGSPAAVVEPPAPHPSNTPAPTPENVPWWKTFWPKSTGSAGGLGKKANTLNGSYSTGLLYPPERSNLYRTVVIHDPPYRLSLDFNDDGTVFSAGNRGTYQISDRKIRFAWDDSNLPVEAEMQGDAIFWNHHRYERK